MIQKLIFFFCSLIGLCQTQGMDSTVIEPSAYIEQLRNSGLQIDENGQISFYRSNTLSGNYLAAQFAQTHYDWNAATEFMEKVMKIDPDAPELMNRAMVLSMGAGQHEKAIAYAKKLEQNPDGTADNGALSQLFLGIDAIKNADYDSALKVMGDIPQGTLSNFIAPLIQAWAYAGKGELKTDGLVSNTIHINHAFLIGDYLDKRNNFDILIVRALGASGLSVQDVERVADTMTLLGRYEDATKLYEQALKNWPDNHELNRKLQSIQAGEKPVYFEEAETPQKGAARALYDMAQLLSIEEAYESARVFVELSLYLDNENADTHLLAGYITSSNQQYEEAAVHYMAVPETAQEYADARRLLADLYEEQGDSLAAVEALEVLAREKKDVNALVQVGDIYRREDNFKKAIESYNRAEDALGGNISSEYWHLNYVRGIAYERDGQWTKAEKDLLQALSYRPENAMILNYLGYAWADQNINLDKALEMIRQAVAAEPEDGYIIDSLGWVLYKMKKYGEAVPHLEKAVELLPYDPIINDHLGDSYWQVGRYLEARFQWERAKNHAEDKDLQDAIALKLEQGLATEKLAESQ